MTDEIPTDVTGGDLNTLWRVANIQFPQVLSAYDAPIANVHTVNGSPDADKYGRCHPWWTTVACQLERAMFSTVGSLFTTQNTLNRAVDAYTRVDGNNGLALNELGQEMTSIIESEGGFEEKIDWGYPEDYEGPNLSRPDDWSDVHDE